MDRIKFSPLPSVARPEKHRRTDTGNGKGSKPEPKPFAAILGGLIQERMDHQIEFEGAIRNRTKSEPSSAHFDLARQQSVDHARRKIAHSDFKLRYALGMIPDDLKR